MLELDANNMCKEDETAKRSENPNRLETLAKHLPCLDAGISDDNKKKKTFEAAAKYLNLWLNEVERSLISGEVEKYSTSVQVLMETHHLIKADIDGNHDRVKEIQRRAKDIIEADHDEMNKVKELEANITKHYENIQTSPNR